MGRSVGPNCIMCDKKLKDEDVIYITGAQAKIRKSHDASEYADISFTGKRNPRGAIHRSCWQASFAATQEKDLKPISPRDRLTSVD